MHAMYGVVVVKFYSAGWAAHPYTFHVVFQVKVGMVQPVPLG